MTTGHCPIEGRIGYLFSMACKRRRMRGSAMMEKIGLKRGHPFILSFLWQKEGVNQSELAACLGIRPASMTAALQRMEKAGWVVRLPDEHDQRVSRVYLSDAGRKVRSHVEPAWDALEEQTFAGFTDKERETLRDFLQRICQNLE